MNAAKPELNNLIKGKADFFDGYPSLRQYSDEIELSFFNRTKLFLLTRLIFLYKFFGNFTGSHKRLEQKISRQLADHENHVLRARGDVKTVQPLQTESETKAAESFYLTSEEVSSFESTGLLGPFDVLSEEEARQIRDFSYEQHQNGGFEKHCIFDKETVDILKRSGEWGLDYSGLYQANYCESLKKVLKRPEIAHRIASLLGENIICWRSQYFEKKPGEIGTFWHQNSVFRETGENEKLKAPANVDPGMIQLTAWVALTDVTRENGALRIIPGSFTDSAVEFFYSFIQDNQLGYVANLDRERIVDLMKIAMYSTGTFYKAQAVFDAIYGRVENLFQGKQIVDLEMKAGQAIIFSSLNMHASFPNLTQDNTRLAYAGRYCNNDIRVFDNMSHGFLPTADGPRKYDVTRLGLMQIHGKDNFGHNNVVA